MLIDVARSLHRLVSLTAPGAEVRPVVELLASVADDLGASRPALVHAAASEWLLGEVDRIAGAARTLHDSLDELELRDGMTTFDAAFAADDASWDAWFAEAADLVRRAQGVIDAHAGQSAIASARSV